MKPFASAVSSILSKDGTSSGGSSGSGERVITGNTFVVLEKPDIKKVPVELYKLEKGKNVQRAGINYD